MHQVRPREIVLLCGPPLGGALAEATGSFVLPFLLAAAVALAGAALSLLVLRAGAPPGARRTSARRRGRRPIPG